MIETIIACAGLCALTLAWVLKPLRAPRVFYGLSFVCALAALGIYLVMGNPGLAPSSATPNGISKEESRELMQQEFTFLQQLEKNPEDADILIRLAALRTMQGRTGPETLALLDRADRILPDDRRIRIIRAMIQHPNP